MNFKNLQAILIDLDHTLYDYNVCHKSALEKTSLFAEKKLNISRDVFIETYEQARSKTNSALKGTASSHNRMLYFQGVLEILNQWSPHSSLELYEIYWSTYIDKMTPFQGVDQFLKQVADLPVLIVTDLTSHIQHRKLAKLSLPHPKLNLLSSEEAGVEKPSHKIFSTALQKMKLSDPERLVMIGDNYKKDILGASNFGIPSFWISHNKNKLEIQNPLITQVENFKNLLDFFI